jgi:pyruvate dehydrogenase E1 component beta subunit
VNFEEELDPFKARIVKEGSDITIVSYLKMVDDVMEAVIAIEQALKCSCEVIDLCSLNPIDYETLKSSIEKTSRLVMVEEDHKTGGYGSQIVAWAAEDLFYELDAPLLRLAGADIPVPYNRTLELASIPTAKSIASDIIEWGRKNDL